MTNEEKIQHRLKKLRTDAAKGGYLLNTDDEVVQSLTEGLIENEDRYGIECCPCRLFKGLPEDNTDIICPCVYRDDDLAEFGACFCSLYIASEADAQAQRQVPERRLSLEERKLKDSNIGFTFSELPLPVYRCSVCGYLCANNNPPRICPICKADAKRFERFI